MRYSSLRAGSRLASLALLVLPAWACATAENNSAIGDQASDVDNDGGASANAGASGAHAAGTANGGASANAGAGNSAGASSGAGPGGSSAGGAAGMAASGGKGSGGASGASNGGGGATNGGAGKSSGGSSSGGAPSGGAPSGGAPSGGAPSGGGTGTCDAAHAKATVGTGKVYTGTATDCVRLSVNPTWAVVMIQMQPQPGSAGYPVPFKFFSCAGNGSGTLTGDYNTATLKSGDNPGCDYYVQFGGGNGALKFTYYD